MAKQDTREKILKAAEDLFSQDGFDGVPTKLIAKEAGITEMTLFNHFPTKKLLYKTVVKERYLSIDIESVISELTLDDLETDLKKVTKILIENFVCNKKVLKMRLKEKHSFQNDENFTIKNDPLLKQVLPVFKVYAEKGVIHEPAEKTATLFMAAFKGLCHLSILESQSGENIKTLTDDYVRTFCHGVVKS